MKQRKTYEENSTVSLRLTKKSGITDEVLQFLNSPERRITQDTVKAWKLWIRLVELIELAEEIDAKSLNKIILTIEKETKVMEQTLNNYGKNKGKTYRKNY